MGRHGENIFKRKDGRWEARVIVCHTRDGKARYRYLYGKTYEEAKEKRNEVIAEMAITGSSPHTVPTLQSASKSSEKEILFHQLLDEWLKSIRSFVKESTFVNYSYLVEHYIRPALGANTFSEITTDMVDSFLKEKLETGRKDGNGGLSSKTVSDIRSVLLQIFDYAKSKNYACNIKGKVFTPKVSKKPIRVLSHHEQRLLETVLYQSEDPVHLGVLIALYCGLRIGEICALQWGDLNLEDATLSISKTVMRIQDLSPDAHTKTKVVIESPKTDTSIRIIPIPTFLKTYLLNFKQSSDCYILTATNDFMEPRCCLSRYKRFLKEAGLDSLTFHALRHTFATRCVEKGIDAKSLSEILGHADVKITLQRYVHPSMELKKSLMNQLEEFSVCSQNRSQPG